MTEYHFYDKTAFIPVESDIDYKTGKMCRNYDET